MSDDVTVLYFALCYSPFNQVINVINDLKKSLERKIVLNVYLGILITRLFVVVVVCIFENELRLAAIKTFLLII